MDNSGYCAKIVIESSIWIFLTVSSLVIYLIWSEDVHTEDICSVFFVLLGVFLLLIESLWSILFTPVEMPREPWLEHWETFLYIYVSQLIDHKQTAALRLEFHLKHINKIPGLLVVDLLVNCCFFTKKVKCLLRSFSDFSKLNERWVLLLET